MATLTFLFHPTPFPFPLFFFWRNLLGQLDALALLLLPLSPPPFLGSYRLRPAWDRGEGEIFSASPSHTFRPLPLSYQNIGERKGVLSGVGRGNQNFSFIALLLCAFSFLLQRGFPPNFLAPPILLPLLFAHADGWPFLAELSRKKREERMVFC